MLPFDFYFAFPVRVPLTGLDLQTVAELTDTSEEVSASGCPSPLDTAIPTPRSKAATWEQLLIHCLAQLVKTNPASTDLNMQSYKPGNAGDVSLVGSALKLTTFERGIRLTAEGTKYCQHLSLTSYHSH